MAGDVEYDDEEEETTAQRLMRFWRAGYVFSESEHKVLRELSTRIGFKTPGPWRIHRN